MFDIEFNGINLNQGEVVEFKNFPDNIEKRMVVGKKDNDKIRFYLIRYWDIKDKPIKYLTLGSEG